MPCFVKKRKHDTLYRMERRVKHLKRSQVAETLGWIGSVGILSSYGLLSFGVISGDSTLYYVLSGLGAFGLAVVTYRHRAYQSFIVNVTFTVLAVAGLARILLLVH